MQTLLARSIERRSLPAESAGLLLSTSRSLAARHRLSDPALPTALAAAAHGPLAPLRELLRLPDGRAGVLVDEVPVPDPATETPPSWRDAVGTVRASRILLLLLATAVGTPFGWRGQQAGRLVTDLVPTRGAEHEQTGASSTTELTLHTEDAFHPRRATHFLLYGLRNPGGVGTMLAPCREALERLTEYERGLLSGPGAPILPDSSYGRDAGSGGTPPPVTAVWGRPGGSGLRFDPAYTDLGEADPQWRSAYRRLGEALRAETRQVPVLPGQVLVVDNDACVHGRVPFSARHDGTDRWLLRVNVDRTGSGRPAAEASEHGYGQQRWSPFGTLPEEARA